MYYILWKNKSGKEKVATYWTYESMLKQVKKLFKQKCEAQIMESVDKSTDKTIGRIWWMDSIKEWNWFVEEKPSKMGRPVVKDKKQRVLIFIKKSVIKKMGGMKKAKNLLTGYADTNYGDLM